MKRAEQHIKKALKTDVRKAFDLLYEHYFADLCVYALRFFDNTDDAQDLVQQTMINLWEQQVKLQETEYLHTYLFRCVHNAGLNKLRSMKQQPKTESEAYLQDLQWEFTDHLISKEQCLEIEQAIEALPSQCRKVLELNRMQGMSYKDIAEQLQISHRTVDSHLTNATKLLRQKLQGIATVGAFGIIILILLKL